MKIGVEVKSQLDEADCKDMDVNLPALREMVRTVALLWVEQFMPGRYGRPLIAATRTDKEEVRSRLNHLMHTQMSSLYNFVPSALGAGGAGGNGMQCQN